MPKLDGLFRKAQNACHSGTNDVDVHTAALVLYRLQNGGKKLKEDKGHWSNVSCR